MSTPKNYGQVNEVNLNNDASANAPAIPGALNLLATLPVNPQRIGYIVQQQSVNVLTVAFDDGASSTPTVLILDPAAAANRQGGAFTFTGMPHYGRIRVFGLAGSQVGAAEW